MVADSRQNNEVSPVLRQSFIDLMKEKEILERKADQIDDISKERDQAVALTIIFFIAWLITGIFYLTHLLS